MTNRRLFTALCILAAALGTACQSVPVAGRGGTTYYLNTRMDTSGVYQCVDITQDISAAVKAAAEGLKDLKIKVTESRSDKIIGQVEGEMADGKKVKITIQKKMEATEMRIYAEKARAQQIFKAIAENLR